MLRISIFSFLLFSVFTSVGLMGQGADKYTQALVFYQDKNYKKAYGVIKTEAERGNKEA
ncbi:MAG: hypothetical protein HKP62_04870, partial [Sulfurovum sp.]|nr:hypothetical protein [Sulfurovum sp.]